MIQNKSEAPLRAPATLSSLPAELVTQIALHLDRTSARSLALVARQFTSPADHNIWQSLDIFLPASYGEYPLVQPYTRSGHGPHVDWAKRQALETEVRHQSGLKERVKKIILLADQRRMGLVEEVTIVQRPLANPSIIQLLEVAPTLKKLELRGSADHVFKKDSKAEDHEMMEVKMIGMDMMFKSLTHLTFRKGSIRFAEYLVEMVNCSPNLLYLEADVSDIHHCPAWDFDTFPTFSKDLSETKIRQLRLTFTDIYDNDGEHPCLDILRNCPFVEQMSLRYLGDDPEVYLILCETASSFDGLQDLHLNTGLDTFCNCIDEGEISGFFSLKRLTLDCRDKVAKAYLTILSQQESLFLPALESLFLSCTLGRDLPLAGSTSFAEPSSAYSMPPPFHETLTACPSLRIIHPALDIVGKAGNNIFGYLDKLENSAQHPGIIRSLVNGNKTLIHARFYHKYYELEDGPAVPGRRIPSRAEIVKYETEDGGARERVYGYGEENMWMDYTEYEGAVVPLDIVKKMRRAEGAKLGSWEGRGIVDGDKGWKVLTDWREGCKQERKRSEEL